MKEQYSERANESLMDEHDKWHWQERLGIIEPYIWIASRFHVSYINTSASKNYKKLYYQVYYILTSSNEEIWKKVQAKVKKALNISYLQFLLEFVCIST